MIKRNNAHPAKKKHTNKPRPGPVVAWTDAQRFQRRDFEFALALRTLAEAKGVVASASFPISSVHGAYYAMHHCAIASILASGGVGKSKSFPESHLGVIEHFSKVSDKIGDRLAGAGAKLNYAFELRKSADYGIGREITHEIAQEVVAVASEFIEVCRAQWSL